MADYIYYLNVGHEIVKVFSFKKLLFGECSSDEAYYYGRKGEVTKTVRTVMASVADIRTYVYGTTYDSWNCVRAMTYPDGEVVTYHYNAAGQVESLTSSKQGKERPS